MFFFFLFLFFNDTATTEIYTLSLHDALPIYIDGDRDLDLFVVNYIDWSFQKSKTCDVNGQPVFCGPGEFSGLPDRLFINLGNGQFSESAESFGFAGTTGKGLVALAADLDNDLQPELYVGNDLSPNLLYTRSRPAFLLQDSNSASTPILEIAADRQSTRTNLLHW